MKAMRAPRGSSVRRLGVRWALPCALGAALLATPRAAEAWEPADLPELTNAFALAMADDYDTHEGEWVVNAQCDIASCFNDNPDTAYGYAVLPQDVSKSLIPKATRLAPTDAVVLLVQTPPPAKYFGFTPYLFQRYYPEGPPSDPNGFKQVTVFQPLGDTANLVTLETAGNAATPFSQLSVLVLTADSKTYADIANGLSGLGYPTDAVNLLTLPVDAVPLRMGLGSTADTYTIMGRVTYAEDPDELSAYVAANPVSVLHLRPWQDRPLAKLPEPEWRVPGSGQPEPQSASESVANVVKRLMTTYRAGYRITEQTVTPIQTDPYTCVDEGIRCDADNPDALYTEDFFTPKTRKDKLLVVGVDHVYYGKATYFSHSPTTLDNQASIFGINDDWLRSMSDWRGHVYAFSVSYDCDGDPICVPIPEPSDGVPGIAFGDPFEVMARIYLEPGTGTRPSVDEIFFHRVFLLSARRPK
jgi:hypothetical protein